MPEVNVESLVKRLLERFSTKQIIITGVLFAVLLIVGHAFYSSAKAYYIKKHSEQVLIKYKKNISLPKTAPPLPDIVKSTDKIYFDLGKLASFFNISISPAGPTLASMAKPLAHGSNIFITRFSIKVTEPISGQLSILPLIQQVLYANNGAIEIVKYGRSTGRTVLPTLFVVADIYGTKPHDHNLSEGDIRASHSLDNYLSNLTK